MASSRVETQITWSSATSVTLSSNDTRSVSDAVTFNVEDWEADLYVSADNADTPESGDYVEFYIHYTAGDSDSGGSDDYATNEYAELLGRLNTFGTDTPGEDPAARVFPIRTAAKSFKVSVEGPRVATNNIVCRARVVTHRIQ